MSLSGRLAFVVLIPFALSFGSASAATEPFTGELKISGIYRESGTDRSYFLAGLPNSKECLYGETHRPICEITFSDRASANIFDQTLSVRVRGALTPKERDGRALKHRSLIRLDLEKNTSVTNLECWIPSDERDLAAEEIPGAFGTNWNR